MVKVKIFIEGGGSGETPDKDFRQAWAKFFAAAGLTGQMPKVVRGEGRNKTFGKFRNELRKRIPDVIAILLVDSEGPVAPGLTAWQHLHARDGWRQPPTAADSSAYLMVQFMETWFLADREALRQYFAPSFNENPFREWPSLEAVPRDTVLRTLEQATGGRYRKGKVSFQLIGRISPDQVAAACPHAQQLLDYLRTLPSAA